ncbi:sodium-dependent transporter [Marinobacter sp. M3C]|jgi:NSS family neurotransmitter:Na+ symporter|uniref:sodium-dependent transporter n=1 Tax=unclassified Marinobacter TaxID=83889 RepID=UPI00200EA8CD|nr:MULTISPECIES: sodium-dependent transporter [unclassified Marinobacter]MCL1478947.1 sodium-dependent transporter [Marinobacter sp.]MCL1480638.1 sodium-dependent transporter [Marinobacter sp.]MCL1484200.1 sodium-dependent transporter [Marinobacter sp.]MCL1487541.1 sodium-dependent transporter [Marinobacter sp.]UQG57764.1 sodium-dependent transporter [Marinobacter sp. M4C]
MTKTIISREQWGSRFGYLMAIVGAMVGAGNIWRMPYVTGENGGGAFLIAYFVLLYLIAVPGLMGETSLGRYTRQGLLGTFRKIYGNNKFVGLGLVILIFNVVLMSYYSSIVGWSLYYAYHAVIGSFTQTQFDTAALWQAFSSNTALNVGMHTVAMLIVTGILLMGIKGGIERMAKWMMPILTVSLIAIAIRGVTLPGAMAGLEFAFSPNWEYLARGETWLAALGQALFSTGLGWGIALTYGSYLGRNDDIPLGGGIFTAIGNTSFGLLAIFAVFPIVFAFGISPTSGAELTFVALASAFGSMTGGYGWALLFFMGFFFANLTTAIAITEVGVTTYKEERNTSRSKAVLTMCGIIWLLGIPSAMDSSILGYLDFVVGNWGLPLATFIIMITIGWKFDASRLRTLSLNRGADLYVPKFWESIIRFGIPAIMLFIMVYFLYSNLTTTPWKTVSGLAILTLTIPLCMWIMSRREANAHSVTNVVGQSS